ncbi:alanine/glycine:cation symporter family protein [Kocuria varians]|uniref:alanine/glycine:cation symporter family protein n=1 Tax=Kocuria varians TaxID=1272 RepID=UPI0008393E22|nr:alanine/glycine:cation symporter family protein [Kocuria varians]
MNLTALPVLPQRTLDETLEGFFGPLVDVLESAVFFTVPVAGADLPLLVVWLLAGGLFLTALLRFKPFRDLPHSLKIVRGHYNRHDDPGQVTSFQALATELSGTVGLGNIAGVAVAISIGGPGASLWIIIAGLLGMSVKMAEATLGQKYRRVHPDGTISGGPMYYLRDGLAAIGRPRLGRVLATAFAIFMMIGALGAGNVFQANQLTAQVILATGGEDSAFANSAWLIGLALAVVTGFVILGGITSIARWTSKLTPLMALLYLGCILVILAVNITSLPEAVGTIFSSAFTGEGVSGGLVGVAIIGIQRALFSNAAGVGTAGLAHSVTKNRRPAQEGFVAAWEPFIDSVVICTMTALAITVTGQYQNNSTDGVGITTAAFATVHSFFPYLLTVCVVLFAFSTILSFSYYGKKATGYLFGDNKIAERLYDVVWLAMIVVGAAVSLNTVVRFSDAMFFLLTVPNLVGLYLLSGVLRKEVLGHREDVRTGQLAVVPRADRSTIMGNKMPVSAQSAPTAAQAPE